MEDETDYPVKKYGFVDNNVFWKFEPYDVCTNEKNPSKKDQPYLLEHVFDMVEEDYVNNNKQCCYYTEHIPFEEIKYIIEDDSICNIEDGVITAYNTGKTSVTLTYPNNTEYTFKVNVYRDKYNGKLFKNMLILRKDNSLDMDTVLHHIHCPHYTECIFDKDSFKIYESEELHELQHEIHILQTQIRDSEKLIDCYLNNEIIYNPLYEDYYNIKIVKDYTSDGSVKHKVTYSLPDNFENIVKNKIKNLKLDLREYNRMKYRLLSQNIG